MNCMKITLHLLALCLLLSITTKVSGKPNPRHLLIETKNKAENNDDYQQSFGGNEFGHNAVVNQINANGGGNQQSSRGNNFGHNARFNQIDASGGGNVATGGSSINTGGNHFGGCWC